MPVSSDPAAPASSPVPEHVSPTRVPITTGSAPGDSQRVQKTGEASVGPTPGLGGALPTDPVSPRPPPSTSGQSENLDPAGSAPQPDPVDSDSGHPSSGSSDVSAPGSSRPDQAPEDQPAAYPANAASPIPIATFGHSTITAIPILVPGLTGLKSTASGKGGPTEVAYPAQARKTAVNMGYIIDGQTLSIGGTPAMVGHTTFSLGPQGITFADPSSNINSTVAVLLAAPIDVSAQSLTADHNLGDVILAAITDGMAGFAGRREEIITTVPFPEAGASSSGAGEKTVVVTMGGGGGRPLLPRLTSHRT